MRTRAWLGFRLPAYLFSSRMDDNFTIQVAAAAAVTIASAG
ncbi:hypothetical protein [Sorangium sp. So ce590]